MKTIGISKKVHKDLMNLKLEYGYKKTDVLLEEMIKDFKKERLLKASKIFREGMLKKKLKLKDVIKKSGDIREEIYNEWFD